MSASDDDAIVIISSHYVEDVYDSEHVPCDQFDPIDDRTPLRKVQRTKTETHVARAVVIVTMSLLVLSVLMIMISLTMSHHIDDLGKITHVIFGLNNDNISTSQRPITNKHEKRSYKKVTFLKHLLFLISLNIPVVCVYIHTYAHTCVHTYILGNRLVITQTYRQTER